MIKISNNDDDESDISEILDIEEESNAEKTQEEEEKINIEKASETGSGDYYEEEKPGRKSVVIGADGERGFKHGASNVEEFQDKLRECFKKFGLSSEGEMSAFKDAPRKKTDIVVDIGQSSIGTSIKTSTKSSFHHLDRRWLEDWKDELNMPEDIYEGIKSGVMKKAQEGRSGKFIQEEDQETVKDFILSNKTEIIHQIFTKDEENLDVMVLNDKTKNKYHFYKMDEFLNFLDENADNNISFSSKGIPKLGDYITIQRKGGDGNYKKYPKTDYRHPSNQIQFKFNPLKFAKDTEDQESVESHEIEYED